MSKLNTFRRDSTDGGASRPHRQGGPIESLVQSQSRDEKNAILATEDADIRRFTDEMKKIRGQITQVYDTVYATADEGGKALLTKFSGEYEKFNKIEDEAMRLALLNSNNRALQFWSGEGVAGTKAVNDGLDAALAKLDRTAATAETAKAASALQNAKFEWERTATDSQPSHCGGDDRGPQRARGGTQG